MNVKAPKSPPCGSKAVLQRKLHPNSCRESELCTHNSNRMPPVIAKRESAKRIARRLKTASPKFPRQSSFKDSSLVPNKLFNKVLLFLQPQRRSRTPAT